MNFTKLSDQAFIDYINETQIDITGWTSSRTRVLQDIINELDRREINRSTIKKKG